MNIGEYSIKDTNICECGHEFDIHEINGLKALNEHGFFSNIVKNYSEIKCPVCQNETILLLKQKGQTWEIIGIGSKKSCQKMAEEIAERVPEEEEAANAPIEEVKIEEDAIDEATIENETENETTNEFICPECGKVCKSQIGLNSHMKTHQN